MSILFIQKALNIYSLNLLYVYYPFTIYFYPISILEFKGNLSLNISTIIALV